MPMVIFRHVKTRFKMFILWIEMGLGAGRIRPLSFFLLILMVSGDNLGKLQFHGQSFSYHIRHIGCNILYNIHETVSQVVGRFATFVFPQTPFMQIIGNVTFI